MPRQNLPPDAVALRRNPGDSATGPLPPTSDAQMADYIQDAVDGLNAYLREARALGLDVDIETEGALDGGSKPDGGFSLDSVEYYETVKVRLSRPVKPGAR